MNRILALGIDKYQHCNDLNNAVRDIQNTLDLLLRNYDFDPDDLTALFNENVTRENIINQFESFTDLTPNDTLLILYAGHGEYNKKIDQGYLLTNETVPSNKSTYLEYSSIFNYLKAIEARHILLISDSCFSGSLFEQRREITQEPNDRLDLIPSRWALTSGRVEPVLDGIPGDNSPFSISLQKALKNNIKELLSISELSNLVKTEVASNHIQIPRSEPINIKGHKGGEFIFKKKLNTIHVVKSVEPKLNRLEELIKALKSNIDNIENSENAGKTGTANKFKDEQIFINKLINEEINSEFEINTTSKYKANNLFNGLVDQKVLKNIADVEEIKEQKNDAVRRQLYEIAVDLRDKESKILNSMSTFFQDSFDINDIILREPDIIKAYAIFISWLNFSLIEIRENHTNTLKVMFKELFTKKIFYDNNIIGLFEWEYQNREIKSKINDIVFKIKNNQRHIESPIYTMDKPAVQSESQVVKSGSLKAKARSGKITGKSRR